jgi:tail tube protein
VETTWGTAPAVQFQAIRYTSETLAYAKTRQRPAEITGTREAAQGVTTQQQASGTINYALSYGTFDDFMSVALQADWGATLSLQSILVDTSIVQAAGVVTITSTLASKFTNIVQGQWFRIVGAVNAANNAWWYVSVKDSNVLMHLTGPNSAIAVSETSAAGNIGIRGGQLRNGTTFKSMFVQQLLSPSLFFTYPGAYVSRMTLQGGIGNFMTGGFDIVAKSENKALVNGSTGTVLAAPSGRVFDPVAGFVSATWNEAVFASAIDQFAITIENTGAAPEFGMGAASAQGILGGTFQVSGTFRAYFKDSSQYDLFTAESAGRLAYVMKDNAGNAYAFTFMNAILVGGGPNIGGPGQPIYATFTVEGGPQTGAGNSTFSIDRMAGV